MTRAAEAIFDLGGLSERADGRLGDQETGLTNPSGLMASTEQSS